MKDSVISSSHHYYVIFFDAHKINSINDIVHAISDPVESEEIVVKNRKYRHIQVLIDRRYGSENALIGNMKRKGDSVYYWYDMYIGKTEIEGKKIFFVAYPYFKLRNYLEGIFADASLKPNYFKAKLKEVMEYMKGEDRAASKNPTEGFDAEIIKYSAAIKDSENASKINLSGINPLNSRAFDILNQDSKITVSTTSLKLRCSKLGIGSLEISFDKLGNYRFWIKRDSANVAVPMVPYAFNFFKDINALLEDGYIGNQTLLEDE